MKTRGTSVNSQVLKITQTSIRLVLMSFAVLFLTYLPATLYGSNGPIASIADPQYEFGQVSVGSTVIHDFLIKNTGTELLTISDVKTG